MPKFEVTVMREILEKACVEDIEAADEEAAKAAAMAQIEAQADYDKTIEWFFVDTRSIEVIEVLEVGGASIISTHSKS